MVTIEDLDPNQLILLRARDLRGFAVRHAGYFISANRHLDQFEKDDPKKQKQKQVKVKTLNDLK